MFIVKEGLRLDASSTSGTSCEAAGASHDATGALRFVLPGGRRRACALPFASMSASFVSAMAAEPAPEPGVVLEPKTNTAYPEEFCTRGAFGCTQLTGLGVRAKNILGLKSINVYTVGVYVDHGSAKTALARHAGVPTDQLVKKQEMYDDLVTAQGVEKSLRLVINYGGLKQSTFLSALDERLAPPLKSAGRMHDLDAFMKQFDGVDFKKGTEFVFTSSGSGKLTTRVNGKEVGNIASPVLDSALFGIYVGKDPVSRQAKESLGRGLAAVLNA